MFDFPFEFIKKAESDAEVIAICAEALFDLVEELNNRIATLIDVVEHKSL